MSVARLVPVVLVATLPACGGPSLAQLVDGKHYREAVCLATDGTPADRSAVARALDADHALYVHAHVVTDGELRAVLGDAAGDVGSRALFVRVRARGNVLPVDRVKLAVALVSDGGDVPAKPLDWTTLAWATHEPLPKGHTEETYATGINVWRGLAAVATGGMYLLFDPMRPSTVATDATPDEYRSTAPRAFALHESMPEAHCEDIRLGGGGSSCEGFFVVDRGAPGQVVLDVKATFEADRREAHDETPACAVQTEARVPLGTPDTIAQRAEALFGDRARAAAELTRERP